MNSIHKQTDSSLTDCVTQALWKDEILRHTDYSEIDVQVVDGVAVLSGHVTGAAYKKRADTAARSVEGIREIKNLLVRDDELLISAAGALGKIESRHNVKFFTGVNSGVVSLNGKVGSAEMRLLAERSVAEVPGVRGVINNVLAAREEATPEDTRFLQPVVGTQIYSRDGLSGKVHKVVINPSNRRVTAMVILVRFSNQSLESKSPIGYEAPDAKRLIIVPMGAIRFLTKISGFLNIDGADEMHFTDYDPAKYTAPAAQWTPPYPYRSEDVLFSKAEMTQ